MARELGVSRETVYRYLRGASLLGAAAAHDRIRLVRLVAALQALAVLHREDKSERLAWRCAFAGRWIDCGRAVQIVEDVLYAYSECRGSRRWPQRVGSDFRLLPAGTQSGPHLPRISAPPRKNTGLYRPTHSDISGRLSIGTSRASFGGPTRSGRSGQSTTTDASVRLGWHFRVKRRTVRFGCHSPPEKWMMASEQFRLSP